MDVPAIKVTPVLEGLDEALSRMVNVRADGTRCFSLKSGKGLVHAFIRRQGRHKHIWNEGILWLFQFGSRSLFCRGTSPDDGCRGRPQFRQESAACTLRQPQSSTTALAARVTLNVVTGNIVMRLTLSEDLKSVTDRTDIVTDIQYKPFESNQPFGGPGAHNGGRLRVGPGGYLWVAGGDRHRGVCPQSPKLLCRKFCGRYRWQRPPPTTTLQRVLTSGYTYGHRNVQGIDFRPSDGKASQRSMDLGTVTKLPPS